MNQCLQIWTNYCNLRLELLKFAGKKLENMYYENQKLLLRIDGSKSRWRRPQPRLYPFGSRNLLRKVLFANTLRCLSLPTYDDSQVCELDQEAGAVQEEGRACWCGVLLATCPVGWTFHITGLLRVIPTNLRLRSCRTVVQPDNKASEVQVRCKRQIAPLDVASCWQQAP